MSSPLKQGTLGMIRRPLGRRPLVAPMIQPLLEIPTGLSKEDLHETVTSKLGEFINEIKSLPSSLQATLVQQIRSAIQGDLERRIPVAYAQQAAAYLESQPSPKNLEVLRKNLLACFQILQGQEPPSEQVRESEAT